MAPDSLLALDLAMRETVTTREGGDSVSAVNCGRKGARAIPFALGDVFEVISRQSEQARI